LDEEEDDAPSFLQNAGDYSKNVPVFFADQIFTQEA
jgi:hypothetical protein